MQTTTHIETTLSKKHSNIKTQEITLDLFKSEKEFAWKLREKKAGMLPVEVNSEFNREDDTNKFLTSTIPPECYIDKSKEYGTIQYRAVSRCLLQEELIDLLEEKTGLNIRLQLADEEKNPITLDKIIPSTTIDDAIAKQEQEASTLPVKNYFLTGTTEEMEAKEKEDTRRHNDLFMKYWIKTGRASKFRKQYDEHEEEFMKICEINCHHGCRGVMDCKIPYSLIQKAFRIEDIFGNIDYEELPKQKVVDE